MKYDRGSFITVPSREKLRGLHPTAQTLYMWLCSYANETGNCFPSRQTLAKDVGCSDTMIDSMLVSLEKEGLLKKKGRKDGTRQLSNLYTVLIVPPLQGGWPPPPTGLPTPSHDVGTNSIHVTKTTEGRAELAVIEEVSEDSPKKKSTAKYKDARIAFTWLPNQQESWNNDLTQLGCGNLLFKRGEEKVRSFVKYVQRHKDDEGFSWRFVTPSDYERKWPIIEDYAKRNR